MDLVVLQININKGQNEELKAACKTLQEYAEFTERAREHRKEMELEDAIRTTIVEIQGKRIRIISRKMNQEK